MRCNPGVILVTFAVAALLVTTSVRADEPAPTAPADSSRSSSPDKSPSCDVPPHLLTTDSTLAKVADAVKSGQPLNILIVGSRSSTIVASEASAYPARLQEMLKEKLPTHAVNVSVELRPKKTAEETAAELPKL